MTKVVSSADGTAIAYDRTGDGPAIVLVHGAFTDKTHPTLAAVATALAPWFTVLNYDRRGRGESGDIRPYAVDREVEDLAAVIAAAGGSAMVFGGSSGSALVLEAAHRGAPITRMALWEPPYHVDETAPYLPADFALQLGKLVDAGRPGDAVALFLTGAAQAPAEVVAAMRADPSWPASEAIAHTLAYEAAVMGPGNALPTVRLHTLTQPTLVLTGGASPAWMVNGGMAVATAIPGAFHRVLEKQQHNVDPTALLPALLEILCHHRKQSGNLNGSPAQRASRWHLSGWRLSVSAAFAWC
ncbi:alpha/beta fold hydrolase [Fodinicola feengrottensis]|uniref:Alpha/beta hydrolase n=1 Tax=Fodinicola feengrottensis TaxID=435914 RepID=A0ABP4SMV8_9ACTN|nr:alpha/beta hydrolase [Fodinicola feengrottensis]